MERHGEVAAEFDRSGRRDLQLRQGRFRMLWIDEDGNGSSVLYDSAEAAAGGVARRLLEGQPFMS